MISVIICCYNHGKFLRQALESAFNQTLDNKFYEIVFVDDGSTDNSSEIAGSYQVKKNYRCFFNLKNKGLPFSCNKGVRLSKGEYTIRLDADDYLEKDALERFYDIACHNDVDFVYSDRYEINMKLGVKKRADLSTFSIFKLIACGVLFKKNLLIDIGGYRNFLWEEYDLYIRYFKKSIKTPYFIPKPLYNYRLYQQSMTSTKAWHIKAWSQLIKEWGIEELKKYGEVPREYIEGAQVTI